MKENVKLYESLLNEKFSLNKKCNSLLYDYIMEFGEEINEQFSLKVESITLKKKIAYCVKKDYKNEPIFQDELDNYIDDELKEYQEQLQDLINTREYYESIELVKVSFDSRQQIKKIFYKIVHLIHPDLHPEYNDNEEIKILWQDAVDAYDNNDLLTLTRVFDKLTILINIDNDNFDIDDVENKIKSLENEINEIKNNNPYLYKFLLEDKEQVYEFHNNLQNEIKDYSEYVSNLKKELSKFNIIVRSEA